ncbi:MAG: hypothetical protein QE263_08005 [Vampirovibrionales bacterium]|nr:hypothetical protein [Vampirovibrionales bacterium]
MDTTLTYAALYNPSETPHEHSFCQRPTLYPPSQFGSVRFGQTHALKNLQEQVVQPAIHALNAGLTTTQLKEEGFDIGSEALKKALKTDDPIKALQDLVTQK